MTCTAIVSAYGGKGAVLCTSGPHHFLPFTGLDLGNALIVGLALLALGLLVLAAGRRTSDD